MYVFFLNTSVPVKAKFHEELSRNRLRKNIQKDHFIICSLFFLTLGAQGLLTGILPQICPRSAGRLPGLRKLKR